MAANYVYGLRDPITTEIRYVGKARNPYARLRGHMREIQNAKTHKQKWLHKLAIMGLIPDVVILETVDESNWQSVERKWIAYGKAQGWPLTNLTDGGDGVVGYEFSEEAREKISRARRGTAHSEETKFKMSLSHLGKGHAHSAESRQHQSEMMKQYWEARRNGKRKKKGQLP